MIAILTPEDRSDNPGAFAPLSSRVKFINTDVTFALGNDGDMPIAGDWDALP